MKLICEQRFAAKANSNRYAFDYPQFAQMLNIHMHRGVVHADSDGIHAQQRSIRLEGADYPHIKQAPASTPEPYH